MNHSAPELEGLKHYFAGLAPVPSLIFAAPFILFLISLAVLPFLAPHFWEKNRNKALLAALFSFPALVFFFSRDWTVLVHTALDYAAFIGLLAALFVISGGIYIRGAFAGIPWVNTLFLLIGALLSNLIGTTGASMLLIRPLLRANHARQHKAHSVIFFIFIVSNCSGLLTPLGDPPLFLGFLKGIAFGWTLQLWPEWLCVNTVLLILFFAVDTYWFNREHQNTREILLKNDGYLSERFGVQGKRNFALLGAVIALILISGFWIYPLSGEPVMGESRGSVFSKLAQISGALLLAEFSFFMTPKIIHEKNHFKLSPLIEVAVLFAGIFLTMIPVLLILETQGRRLGVTESWQFFWAAGGLSSFLDNAPTYLSFTSLAKGLLGFSGDGLSELARHPDGIRILKAISCGAVLMGANTYIGNGPNFMVKTIAEHAKVKMPGFFAYMLWSAGILIPIFLIITPIFFR